MFCEIQHQGLDNLAHGEQNLGISTQTGLLLMKAPVQF